MGDLKTKWLVPWQSLPIGSPQDSLVQELQSELVPAHVLFAMPVRPIAKRQDCDEVLFELLDGSGRYAVVHLTYAQHLEPDPRWPETRVFGSWDGFVRECMQADHANWVA
jgi:hypothetical protein